MNSLNSNQLKEKSQTDGILLVDKPVGCTSFDIIRKLRKILNTRKMGHAGTLDPASSGLMILLLGKATKLSDLLMKTEKEYEGEITLGEERDTYDSEGTVISRCEDLTYLTNDQIIEEMQKFIGEQEQVPPMYSAKKVNGVPLYKLARKGKIVERKPSFVEILSFDALEINLPVVKFRLSCSKGTYVRSVVSELGEKLKCGAYLSGLRRTKSGKFSIEDSVALEELESLEIPAIQSLIIPCEDVIKLYGAKA